MNNFSSQLDNMNEQTSYDPEEGDDNQSTSESNEIELVTSSKIPWLQEVTLTGTKILVLVVTLVVITLSIVAKVAWWVIILRAGVSILVLGILGYLLNWILGKYLVEAKLVELKAKVAAEEAAEAERLAREQAEMDALAELQQQENENSRFTIET
jgi:uncharacterized membrane protein (DUF106 family)